jgi:dipeptidyl aminopeptidase/acylaminoacyl peptidase
MTLKLWRVSDGELVRTMSSGSGSVMSVAFSPDGTQVAAGSGSSQNPRIRLWRAVDGQLLHLLEGHTGAIQSLSFSTGGSLLISGSADRTIRLWRVSDGVLLRTYTRETGTGVNSVACSPDGRWLAYGRADATVVMAHRPGVPVEGDATGNGCVDDQDLLLVLFDFGRTGEGLLSDLNGNGVVDDADLLIVLFNYGAGC